MTDALMRGIRLPARLKRGPNPPERVQEWVDVVGELYGRGVKTPWEIHKLLGVPYSSAKGWWTRVQEQWSTGMSDQLVNHRRESLYSEADAVSRQAWLEAMQAETPSEKASLFKVILMANQRKASLTGLDALEIKINKTITSRSTLELVASVEAKHGLAPGALEQLGRSAAILMSPGGALPEPVEIIDVEEVE
jgi:hypothetical protein